MKTFLIAIGTVLILFLCFSIYERRNVSLAYLNVSALPIGDAFDDNAQIPVQEFKSKYKDLQSIMANANQSARLSKRFATVTDWLTLFLTAIITLIIGFTGRLSSANSTITLDAAGAIEYFKNNAKLMRLIGMVAALSSICAGVSTKLNSDSDQNHGKAIEISHELSSERVDWFNAKTPEDAIKTLNRLNELIVKYK